MNHIDAIWKCAKEYCGDPASHEPRGSAIKEFLIAEGLRPQHRLLDLGCGALSHGATLIPYLDPGNYVGVDPNRWLIEIALEKHPWLAEHKPHFTYCSDFNPEGYGPFDFILSHSVMSHMAQWQMELALVNVRMNCDMGAVWISSIRLDQYDLCAQNWVYPDVSYFRLETVQALGYHAGWFVEEVPEYRKRLMKVASNDRHDWLRLRAMLPSDKANELRLAAESRLREQRELADSLKSRSLDEATHLLATLYHYDK